MAAAAKGLEHVVLGRSSISEVGGETGTLVYRGFDIGALVDRASYEGVVELLLTGEPPREDPPATLVEELARARALPSPVANIIDALDPRSAPMDALRTITSTLGGDEAKYPPTREQGLHLIARSPTGLAAFVRSSRGERPLDPDPDLGHVENFLYLLSGKRPSATEARALTNYFLMLADHGMNASTLALRVVISTNADLFGAATAALAALKGPAHGGAPSKVSDMLDAIGDASAAEEWIAKALQRRERLMGFGHRAYKVKDPRAILLHRVAKTVADPKRLALAEAVEAAGLAALRREKPGQRLFTNVEFYSAVVLEAVGLPRELFTPTFALARTAGWTAHALEQSSDNRLIRPDVEYVGPRSGRVWPASSAPTPN